MMTSKETASDSHSNSSNNSHNHGHEESKTMRNCSSACELSRTVLLRILLTVSLLLATAVCTAVSFGVLKDAEQEVGRQTYESIAESGLAGAQAIASRKLQGSLVLSTLLSQLFPDESNWPLIRMDGFAPIAQTIADLSNSGTQSLAVLLDFEKDDTPSIAEFEAHTQQVYEDEGRPEAAGVSEFGFGVWKPDPKEKDNQCDCNDCRLHDTATEIPTTWNAQRHIATPLLFHNVLAPNSLLYNLYSQENRGIHIDSMLDCVEHHTNTTTSPSCAVVTDVLELKVKPGPAGLLFQPVFPIHNPTSMVGFTVTSIHWEEVLTTTFPDFVSGLTCVVSTDTTAYTYEIRKGVPHLIGPGDHHHEQFTHYAKSVILNPHVQTGTQSAATYTLTLYPTAGYFESFRTNSPLVVSLGMFAVVAFCTLVFVLYDTLMRHEAHQRKAILEMKRRFVRFISHEIRTPLNTVCMGLELLLSELNPNTTTTTKSEIHQDHDDNKTSKDDVEFWYSVCTDIQANAHTSVEILNDLLNYDKLEMGTLSLETGNVSIQELVERTVQQFQIQAVNKKVDLEWKQQQQQSNNNDNDNNNNKDIEAGGTGQSESYKVLGDDVKLGQVLRNLISNALKFTPADGSIQVTTTHIPNGLPDAQPILLSEKGEEPQLWSSDYPRAGSIQITVKDSGIGLTKAQLQQLFQEGVQFDANRLQHGGGSGLGLAIAKGIVEQHSGTISAQSEGHGTGTTFLIELPLYDMSHDEAIGGSDGSTRCSQSYTSGSPTMTPTTDTGTSTTTGATQQRNKSKDKKRHILVAEDAVSSLKMMIRLLERAGHTCVGAENGKEAVDAIQADLKGRKNNDPDNIPFDIVLLDYEMPIMKGPEAAQTMRNMGYEGPIVGITGNILSEDVDYFKAHGATEVLPKPVTMARINAFWEHHDKRHRRRKAYP